MGIHECMYIRVGEYLNIIHVTTLEYAISLSQTFSHYNITSAIYHRALAIL